MGLLFLTLYDFTDRTIHAINVVFFLNSTDSIIIVYMSMKIVNEQDLDIKKIV